MLQVSQDGIEPFDVADLEDGAFRLRQFDQFAGLGGVVGHRFFHQHMFAGGEEAFGEVEMRVGRGDDAEGVGPGEGVANGGGRRATRYFSAILAAWVCGKVMHAGEFDQAGGGEIGVDAGVFLAQGADPEHRDFKI